MNGTTIQTVPQAAGVECPKRTGDMPWDDDCRKCRHYDACMAALKRGLGDDVVADPLDKEEE